ncbi:hypothetical protein AA23498_1338 [Acetobacter nitrogenifigens DSM 23921 = NBRC 105050]|uniref:Peptidase C39-like domain-containing protein n=1 Tax=Acetobacter nitrogenifigens DSM 23921 = NBRC 105050 TaxID=1120919 RepID=A0A511X5G5_9PROT|nr:hypothetical protein [Acetobacter nitrogenifigens]GBQ92014.1 hypothetical protein AA23498_1338 [Acetobacter nitrogenifigens DSM 23921 = NBRC 105050]GEN58155.1 hypothetical protein ANI02nite_00390 [Acetobacter nitrogenifigens DSM 23921 = NBRC 105050]
MQRKLGKLAPRHDARTYRLTPILNGRLIPIPASCDWSKGISYDMNGNDQYGDCADAARAAMVLTWTSRAQAPMRLTLAQVLADYAATTRPPFDPKTGANDNGTVLLDLLNHWCRDGLSRPGQTADYLTAYGALTPTDHDSVRRAIYALGGVYLGIQVPNYLMTLAGDWTYQPNADWSLAGGHCIAAVGFDDFGPRIFTWGGTRRMEWRLWDKIVDEAYGLVSKENWTNIPGLSPNGEALDALVAEMRASAA